MTSHTFSYRYVDSSKLSRPIIPVSLKSDIRHLEVYSLIDSGADFCMFDGELSYILDIDLAKLEKITLTGINGIAEGYIAHLQVGVDHIYHPMPVIFSFDFSPRGFSGIVGQVGFFDAFEITFDRKKREIRLR